MHVRTTQAPCARGGRQAGRRQEACARAWPTAALEKLLLALQNWIDPSETAPAMSLPSGLKQLAVTDCLPGRSCVGLMTATCACVFIAERSSFEA